MQICTKVKPKGSREVSLSVFLNNSKVIHLRPLLLCSTRLGAWPDRTTKCIVAVNRIQECGIYHFPGKLIHIYEISKKDSAEYIIKRLALREV